MTSSASFVDDLIKDYLLFRDFGATLQTFENDMRENKEKGFRPERVVEQILSMVHQYDLRSLQEYWNYMDSRIFCRLEHQQHVRKLETNLYRYYLVYAVQSGHPEAVTTFFQRMGTHFHDHPDWKDWFALPYLPNPSEVATFQNFFTKVWQDTFLLSLRNFFSVVFHSMPTPVLMACDVVKGSGGVGVVTLNSPTSPASLITGEIIDDFNAISLNTRGGGVSDFHQQPKEKVSAGTRSPSLPRERVAATSSSTSSKSTSDVSGSELRVIGEERYREHVSSVVSCQLSPSGVSAASLDEGGVVKVWSLSPSPTTSCSIVDRDGVRAFAWASSRDRLLVFGTRMGVLRLFDTHEKRNVTEARLEAGFPRIMCLTASPTGNQFVCSSSNNSESGSLSQWDAKTMSHLRHLQIQPEPVLINCAAYNHNGQLLMCGGADGRLRLFDMRCVECIASWRGHGSSDVLSLAFSTDETQCFSVGSDSRVTAWSLLRTGEELAEETLAAPPGRNAGPGRLLALDPEGGHILVATGEHAEIFSTSRGASTLTKVATVGSSHQASSSVLSVDWGATLHCNWCVTAGTDHDVCITTLLQRQKLSSTPNT